MSTPNNELLNFHFTKIDRRRRVSDMVNRMRVRLNNPQNEAKKKLYYVDIKVRTPRIVKESGFTGDELNFHLESNDLEKTTRELFTHLLLVYEDMLLLVYDGVLSEDCPEYLPQDEEEQSKFFENLHENPICETNKFLDYAVKKAVESGKLVETVRIITGRCDMFSGGEKVHLVVKENTNITNSNYPNHLLTLFDTLNYEDNNLFAEIYIKNQEEES